MQQILQTLKTGDVEVVEVPVPAPRNRSLIIRNRASLVSAGTKQSNAFIKTAG
jgi:polar amino acid transport system substrate-binding protein